MKYTWCRKGILSIILVLSLVLILPFPYARAATGSAANNRFNVMIVLDASNSMNETDPKGLRFEAISQFTNLLAEQGNVLGGIVFSNNVSGQQSLIPVNSQTEKDQVTGMLKSVPATGYTNIGEALSTAVSMIEENGDPALSSVILFLSDGNTEMPTAEELSASLEQKADAIQKAREDRIVIYSVCLNADNNADVTEMKQISNATSGVFQEVSRAEDLQDAFNAFYSLIYGTSTIMLADKVFPPSGRLETNFEVPGLGVEEVNIIIYGNTSKISVLRPDGTESDVSAVSSDTFTMIKLTDTIPGKWTLITEGTPGDQIKINMVYNTNLSIDVETDPGEQVINPADSVVVKATLKEGATAATNNGQYVGYTAELQIMDAYGDAVESVPMKVVEDHFEVSHNFDEGTYYYKVLVAGNHLEKASDTFGPLTVTSSAMTEEERNNTAPTPVNETLEENVYIWPFKGGSYSLDLQTLATDAQDSTLHYEVVSSSFIEGTDYSVDANDQLVLDHFSLSKGAFTIRATDSGGLSCDIEVIVKSHNVGLMALIGIGIAALVALAVFSVLLYLALTRPFRGTISVQSYSNGSYKGIPRTPKRGRCKLTAFGLDPVGLDYNKSYFQATGEPFIWLNTNVPVIWNGQKTNKVRIQSGAEVTLTIREGDYRRLHVRFDSRMRGGPRSARQRPTARAKRR